jgi:ribonuclease P protein component
MKKLYVVKHQQDFDRIIKLNNKKVSPYFIIYSEDNDKKYDCYGISVSKKIGNAVYRNKMKRRIRNIIDDYKKDYNNQKNYIIILRRKGKDSSYNTLKDDFFNIMTR